MSQPKLNLPPFQISPPLLNSSNPWATNEEHLLTLYASPHTGAVTTRTSLLTGFPQDPTIHQHTFFSPSTGHSTVPSIHPDSAQEESWAACERVNETSSLNTYGYSPHPFEKYLGWLRGFRDAGFLTGDVHMSEEGGEVRGKAFIVSVTGTPSEVSKCLEELLSLQNEEATLKSRKSGGGLRVMMEINLSCPNIPSKPPPAYNKASLLEYFQAIEEAKAKFLAERKGGEVEGVHVGIKIPPYTYHAQFVDLLSVPGFGRTINFITAVNTLGGCLVLDSENQNSLGSASGLGIGGMAGDALHPLALGNVRTLRSLLDASEDGESDRSGIKIIGVGGVKDSAGFERMRSVGADAVGVGTEFGRAGMEAFCAISEAEPGKDEERRCRACWGLEGSARTLLSRGYVKKGF